MVSKLIEEDFGHVDKEDFSCSERILYGSNIAYNLGLDKESLKMSAGLSAGVYAERTCGALTAGAMVLAKLFVKDRAHEGEYHKELINELITRYEEEMGTSGCAELKEDHRTEEEGCKFVILKAAHILDHIILREQGKS